MKINKTNYFCLAFPESLRLSKYSSNAFNEGKPIKESFSSDLSSNKSRKMATNSHLKMNGQRNPDEEHKGLLVLPNQVKLQHHSWFKFC